MRSTSRFVLLAALLAAAAPALATVPVASSTSGPYTCDGTSTVAFTVGFRFIENSHLVVTKTLVSTGAVSPLALTADYTVSGAGSATGGTVTLVAASRCGAGYTLSIKRSVPLTQTTALSTQGGFSPKAIENGLDRAAMASQQIKRDLDELAAKQAADMSSAATWNVAGTADPSTLAPIATGGTSRRPWSERAAELLNVKDFGAVCDAQFVSTTVGWSGTDDTAAIQAAINYVSQSARLTKIRIPEGACLFTRLYGHYDAVNNPGFSQTRFGALAFEGAGWTNDTNSTYSLYGSVLASNVATGSAFNLGAPGNIVTRDVTIRGLSIQGMSGDGFVVDARGLSYFKMEDSEVIANSSTGSGMNLENPLLASLHRVRVINRQPPANGTDGTGNAGIVFYFQSPWTYSGLFQIEENSYVAGFSYGARYTGGGLQTFNVKSSEIQGAKYGIYVSGGSIDVVGIEDFYAEGYVDSWVKDIGSSVGGGSYVGVIRNLNVNKWFGYGYYARGPHISLSRPSTVSLTTVHVQDLYTSLLNIAADPDGAKAYSVRGVNVYNTRGVAPTPFTIFAGQAPSVAGLDWPSGDTSITVSSTQFRSDPWTGVGGLTTTNDFVNRHPAATGDPCYTLATSGGTRRWSICYDHTTSLLYFRDVNGARTALTISPTTGTVSVKYELAWDPATAATVTGLGTPANGTMRYCSDCTVANPCAAGGTGAIAKRLNGAWVCN